MTREEKRQIIDAAADRAFEALSKVTSGEMHTEGAKQLLDNIASLRWMAEAYALDHRIETTEPPVPEEVQPKTEPVEPVPEQKHAPEPVKPPEVTGVDEPKFKMEEVRAALAKARGRGVNVSEIIRSFGVETFPQLDKSQYPAVMAKLEET